MKIYPSAFAGLFAIALAAAPLGQCQSPPDAAPERLKVILLRPAVRFEDATTISPVPGAGEAEYARVLLDAARSALGSRVTQVEVEKLDAPVAEACASFEPLASRLARGDVNEDALAGLKRLAAIDERYAVLVEFFRLKTGPGRSWNSYTGAITSSLASTLVQVALVSAGSGKVLWKGEQLIRNKALKPTAPDLSKMLTVLYRDAEFK